MIRSMMLRAVLVVLALAFAQDAAAQDKPVSVVDTDPMPVSIEAVAPTWLAPAGPRERYPQLRWKARR